MIRLLPVRRIVHRARRGDQHLRYVKLAAGDMQTVVLPGAGHWIAEQAPEEMLAALTAFLAPYRGAAAATPDPSPLATA
jgi:pimeloyl-ACP methyl ester carboxylesterase